MKVTKIIRSALVKLGVYATGEEVSADDALEALDSLNALLAEYRKQPLLAVPDIDLPLDIQDDLVVKLDLQRVIILGLAIELAPDYGVEPSALVVRAHNNATRNLKYRNIKPSYRKSDLSSGYNRGGIYG